MTRSMPMSIALALAIAGLSHSSTAQTPSPAIGIVIMHGKGGLFALYFGGKQLVDGIIAIAPGGDVSNTVFREKLGASVDLARTAPLAAGNPQ